MSSLPRTYNLLSVCMDLPILDILSKPSHTICGILWVSSATEHVFKVHHVVAGITTSFLSTGNIWLHGYTTFCLSTHQLVDMWIISTSVLALISIFPPCCFSAWSVLSDHPLVPWPPGRQWYCLSIVPWGLGESWLRWMHHTCLLNELCGLFLLALSSQALNNSSGVSGATDAISTAPSTTITYVYGLQSFGIA